MLGERGTSERTHFPALRMELSLLCWPWSWAQQWKRRSPTGWQQEDQMHCGDLSNATERDRAGPERNRSHVLRQARQKEKRKKENQGSESLCEPLMRPLETRPKAQRWRALFSPVGSMGGTFLN